MKSILYCGIDPSDKRYDPANLNCLSICHVTKSVRHAKTYSVAQAMKVTNRVTNSLLENARTALFSAVERSMICRRVLSFRVIWNSISDPRSLRSWCIKVIDKSTLVTDPSVPLMHSDPRNLGSMFLIQITPKQGALSFSSIDGLW